MKKRGLGKGLDALLGVARQAPERERTQLDIKRLLAGKFQPRRRFSTAEMNELANSVAQHGIIQPLIVRRLSGGGSGEDKFEIIAGERRFRAAKMAGHATVPVVIRDIADDDARLFALIENLQRADLNPVEQATGIAGVISTLNLTHEEAGRHVGMSRSAVSNLLRLLELAAPVRKLVEDGVLEMGSARALLALPQKLQLPTAKDVVRKKLTTRATEMLVRKLLAAANGKSGGKDTRNGGGIDADTRALERELSENLSVRVEIQPRKNGGGKLVINYGSLNSLDRVLKKLR